MTMTKTWEMSPEDERTAQKFGLKSDNGNEDSNKNYHKYLEHSEWVFNDYSDYYERYELENTNQDEFESWLFSVFSPRGSRWLELVKIEKTAGALERRYELIRTNYKNEVHMRIATHPIARRVLVFARGSEWHFSATITNTGREAIIRYYLEFEDFCRKMLSDWHMPLSDDFLQEKLDYPANHKIWREMSECRTRIGIDYSKSTEVNSSSSLALEGTEQQIKNGYDTPDIRKAKNGVIRAKQLMNEDGKNQKEALIEAGVSRQQYYYWKDKV